MSEFHSLANLIKRLEVATTRLEDLAMSSSSASAVMPAASSSSAAVPAASSSENEIPSAVKEFDDAINPSLEKFMDLSAKLGNPIQEQAKKFEEAVKAERDFIYTSTVYQKIEMSNPIYMKLLQPLQSAIADVLKIKDDNRSSPQANHLNAVGEGVSALGWFTCEPTPVPFIRDMKDASQLYVNRVKIEDKNKKNGSTEWVNAFTEVIESTAYYVKDKFPTGLSWNPQGKKIDENSDPVLATTVSPVAPAPAAPSAGGPPPPPPPPPPMVLNEEKPSHAPTGAAAVFAEINKGTNVTSNLRKVDQSEMTHKNPNLRRTAAPSSPKKQGPPTPSKPDKYTLKKAAKTSLEANKWVIENHEGNKEIIINDTAINQAVYIFNCKDSTIQIKGKVNAITMDSCSKCGLVVDSTVSTVDIVNCKSFGLQILKIVPTIAVDKCDSGEIYLNKECLGAEILSAKSTSLNVLLPENEEFKETPIPEQFKTTIVNGKLVTSTVEHTG